MPETTRWKIYYPTGAATPNIPVQDQTQAESVEVALDLVGAPPSVILRKNSQSSNPSNNVWSDIVWEIEDHKVQGIVHQANSSAVTVPTDGVYTIFAKLGVNAPALSVGIQLQINGVDQAYTINNATSAAGNYDKVNMALDVKLTAGAVLKIRGRVNSTTANFDGSVCLFTVRRSVSL